MALSEALVSRFSRQLLVPGFGEVVQERLLALTVRVVGADAVASAGLVVLLQAGVGRLWLDDAEDVGPADRKGWLFPPSAVGASRAEAARAVLAGLSHHTAVEPYPAGGVPGAALVFASSADQGLSSAEEARRAGIPHVVVEPDADGGAVVSVPRGAPCFACGRSVAGVGRPPDAGIAALAALAAGELLVALARPEVATGRRIDLVRGVPHTRPTARVSGCACGGAPGAPAADSA